MAFTEPAVEIIKDAIIPLFGDPVTFEYSDNIPLVFSQVVNEYKHLFQALLRWHIITYLHKGHQCVFHHAEFLLTTERL